MAVNPLTRLADRSLLRTSAIPPRHVEGRAAKSAISC